MSDTTRIVTDRHGRIVDVSDGAAELLAIEDRWLIGRPLAAFVPREHVRDFWTLLLARSDGHGAGETSLPLQRPTGERVDFEIEAVAGNEADRLEWRLAEPRSVMKAIQPVPAISGPPLRRLLDRLPVGVVSVNKDLTVDYLNPSARDFVPGARVGAMLPDAFEGFSLRVLARNAFGETAGLRRRIELPSGRMLEVDSIAGGKNESALLLVQDVTERERGQRAEREFAANAAHELRTPIAAIRSALDVLDGGAKDVPEDRELFLGHIERETARLTRLVEALMLLARIQTGEEQPSLRIVDVAPLLGEIAAGLEPQDGVHVHVSCPAEVAMLADADLLYQAVWNLAANAARYTVVGEIRLSGRDLGSLAEIEVYDTGSGIAVADREHVFDRFFRAQRRPDGGFGLGLPLSQEIARALGGSVTLDSELGVGTSVRVQVPSARLVA